MNPSFLIPNLKHFLAHLSTSPGVYRMLDAEGRVLYVGKAANLKKRVSSYFNKHQVSVKTRSLIEQVTAIEVHITRSEAEALLLESSLIKSLRPKYNVLMRDDKSYPYLYINSQHPYPRLSVLRSKTKPKTGDVYGPYPSTTSVRETLNLIQKVFKIRNCTDNYFNGRTRPCLQYQIKRCSAPCTQLISKSLYQQSVKDAERFLQGKSQVILKDLETNMDSAVALLEFEEAARLRDQIKNLRAVQEQQAMIFLHGDVDVIVIEAKPGLACVQWVSIREGNVLGSRSFFPTLPKVALEEGDEALWQQVFAVFLGHFYVDSPNRVPPLILTNHAVDDLQALQAMLTSVRGKSCHIQTKPRGIKRKWVDFALTNLQKSLSEQMHGSTLLKQRYVALQAFLKLDNPIQRMECMDISHTQGTSTIASCVVFDEQGPVTREYRLFNISNITPGDDYGAMKQAITRRFKKLIAENNLPTVFIVDGGRGQVAAAQQIFSDLGVQDVVLLGISKGKTRKAGWEHLILADVAKETNLPPDSPALHLLQHIRDEAHRFAITRHRKKREKTGLESTLQSIEGVGTKRRQALLKRFGGLRDLAKAPLEEIAKVPGINAHLAARIYQYFHP